MRAPLRRVRCRLVAQRAGEVVVRTDEGEEVTLGASGPAEDAAALTGAELEALYVAEPNPRLVWLRRAGAPAELPPPERRSQAIRERWARTLEILSR